MNKKFRKILCVCLCIVLAVSLVSSSVLAVQTDVKTEAKGYTVIGDSFASGYGLPQKSQWGQNVDGTVFNTNANGQIYYDKLPLGSNIRVPNMYASLVASKLGLADNGTGVDNSGWFYNQTRSGWRSIEELRMLDPDFDASEQYDMMSTDAVLKGHSSMTDAQIEDMRANSQNQIKNSRLVTVQLGINDLIFGFTMSTYTIGDTIGKIGELGAINATTGLAKGLAQSFVGFALYYPQVISRIYELNPNATVCGIGLRNFFRNMGIVSGDNLNIGRLLDIYYEAFNLVIKSAGASGQDYEYIDIQDMPLAADGDSMITQLLGVIGINLTGSATGMDGLHPDEEGHQWIANAIVDAVGDRVSLGGSATNVSTVTTASDLPFNDVSSTDWYYTAVKNCYANGYMSGTSSTTFEPYSQLTRGMVATILYSIANKPSTKGSSYFSDVKDSSQWYTTPINWAYENGIMSGYEDGTARPNNNVTREELAVMLRGFAPNLGKSQNATGDLSAYADGEGVSTWATDAIKWAVGNGIISGTDENKLNPQSTATRAEAAQMIYKFTK